jgi:hypothetical protein
MISLRIWRDLKDELLVCLKACLFIRVPKLKEITKNVSVTSQLLALLVLFSAAVRDFSLLSSVWAGCKAHPAFYSMDNRSCAWRSA